MMRYFQNESIVSLDCAVGFFMYLSIGKYAVTTVKNTWSDESVNLWFLCLTDKLAILEVRTFYTAMCAVFKRVNVSGTAFPVLTSKNYGI